MVILLMIGLPVLLLTGGATVVLTTSVSTKEALPYLLGTTEAAVRGPVAEFQVEQDASGSGFGYESDAPAALPVPGFGDDPSAAIAQLVDGVAIAVTEGSGEVGLPDGPPIAVNVLGIDLEPGADLGARARLLSGRWPLDDSEVVVTTWGRDRGVSTTGTIELRVPPSLATERTVVGVAEATIGIMGTTAPAGVVVRPYETPSAWLVTDRGPVDWAEVQELNAHALLVVSRAVVQTPPPVTGAAEPMGEGGAAALAGAAAGGGLLVTTCLLAGPAFAVSASRQRRVLALCAAQGASPGQVRRTVLAQALALGGAAAAIGVGLGVAAVYLLRPVLAATVDERLFLPVDVSWLFLGLLAGSAVLSAVVAALLPARALGRLDITQAMCGREVTRPVSARLLVVGAGLLVLGAVTSLTQLGVAPGQGAGVVLVVGSASLTVGALLTVPALLTLSERLSAWMPAPARMAVRSSARQRARTGPTVAAVMACATLLSTGFVALASDTASRAAIYVPEVAPGTAVIRDGGEAPPGRVVDDVVAAVDPALTVVHSSRLSSWPTEPGTVSTRGVLVAGKSPGCTAEQSLWPAYRESWDHTESAGHPGPWCGALGVDTAARLAPGAQLAALLQLDATQQQALDQGAVVLPDPGTVPESARPGTFDALRPAPIDVTAGRAAFWVLPGSYAGDRFRPEGEPSAVSLPALLLPWDQFARGSSLVAGGVSAYLSTEAADRLGWLYEPGETQLLPAPGAGIDSTTEAELERGLQALSPTADIRVERGFERDDQSLVLVVMGVGSLLILVATLTSTALSVAEQHTLMGTLAAVGATRRTRRTMAATQAFQLAGLGALTGVAIGLIPGAAIARTFTSTKVCFGSCMNELVSGPFVVVPWLQVILPVVIVPTVAAAFAFVSIRRAPALTRRVT